MIIQPDRPGAIEGEKTTDDRSEELGRLRAELQERDDILAMASHELRNPLHALALQVALARATAEAHAETDTLARIRKAEATLARYIDRVTVLMDLMRGPQSDYPLSLSAFDLSAVIEVLVDSVGHEARFRGIAIRTELPSRCEVLSDKVVVEQVLDNLVLNALKHADCAEVVVRLHCGANTARIEVSDNGRGIAESDQQRIFGKAIVASEGERGSGTGLGLWIVRKLVSALGGGIELESRPSAGSTFKLKIPLNSTDATGHAH